MNGYGGSILRVDLSSGKSINLATPRDLAKDFIGGRGFGAYLLFRKSPNSRIPLDRKIN